MKTTIDSIRLQGDSKEMKVIIIESGKINSKTPLLLFLHGAGEASKFENQLPHVFDHFSPPFQVVLGRLKDTIVIAPQAPFNIKIEEEKKWNWRTLVSPLNKYIYRNFHNRNIYLTGFSRGGLGVLQLINENKNLPEGSRNLFYKWAIVDPQNAVNDEEEKLLFNAIDETQTFGWLRYGGEYLGITLFSDRLKNKKAVAGNVAFINELFGVTPASHGRLGFEAFNGNKLEGTQNLYEYFGLNWS